MTKTGMIRARVEPELKAKAEKLLDDFGLTPSIAIRIFYKQIVKHKGHLLDVLRPGDETLQAMEDDKKGRMVECKDHKELRKKLGV
jgi:DNA-damage-inducible protein J